MTNNETTRSPWEVGEACVLREDSPQAGRIYDLEERTARFGEAVIDFLKQVPLGPRTNRLVDQLTGCGTSVGGNYCEADDAVSHKEFIKIIGTCRKESRETKFFLRMIARACPDLATDARKLWHEANELHLIFSKIRRTAQQNQTPAT
ncbi:MAG: four helix bundle protein [Verrucomicrobia bacterium]|nr:four helix bundle protein [Verrucomicrobiota bacterium]